MSLYRVFHRRPSPVYNSNFQVLKSIVNPSERNWTRGGEIPGNLSVTEQNSSRITPLTIK